MGGGDMSMAEVTMHNGRWLAGRGVESRQGQLPLLQSKESEYEIWLWLAGLVLLWRWRVAKQGSRRSKSLVRAKAIRESGYACWKQVKDGGGSE